jgi:hypothetical protein
MCGASSREASSNSRTSKEYRENREANDSGTDLWVVAVLKPNDISTPKREAHDQLGAAEDIKEDYSAACWRGTEMRPTNLTVEEKDNKNRRLKETRMCNRYPSY